MPPSVAYATMPCRSWRGSRFALHEAGPVAPAPPPRVGAPAGREGCGHPSRVPPFVRGSPPRRRTGHPHRAGAARASRRGAHADLHPRLEPRSLRSQKPHRHHVRTMKFRPTGLPALCDEIYDALGARCRAIARTGANSIACLRRAAPKAHSRRLWVPCGPRYAATPRRLNGAIQTELARDRILVGQTR
jgi:hypothetical protein